MFEKIGQIFGAMKNLPKIREEMDKLQSRLGQIYAEGDAGAGLVRVRVNGRMELVWVRFADDAFREADREFIEDLVVAAVNQALAKVRQHVAEETSKMAVSLGLPADWKLPG